MGSYIPSDTFHATTNTVDDGTKRTAASVNVCFNPLADNTIWLNNHMARLDSVAHFTGEVIFSGVTEIDTTVECITGGINFDSGTSLLIKTGATCTINGGFTCNIGSVSAIHGSLTVDGNATFQATLAVDATSGGGHPAVLMLASSPSIRMPTAHTLNLAGSPEIISRSTTRRFVLLHPHTVGAAKQVVLDAPASAVSAPQSGDEIVVAVLHTGQTNTVEIWNKATSGAGSALLATIDYPTWNTQMGLIAAASSVSPQPKAPVTELLFQYDGSAWSWVGGSGIAI